MPLFTKESLERLRERIDLVELLAPYVQWKKQAGTYKALCPFHKEKSPSFLVRQGDTHYHCFGCGAHGDAIGFLMQYLKLNFAESVEFLAQKFGIPLSYEEGEVQEKKEDLAPLRSILNDTAEFFHKTLIEDAEGKEALAYLAKRGIDLAFIKFFKIGWAPHKEEGLFNFFQKKKFDKKLLVEVGLVRENSGKSRAFFADRITFPILDVTGNTIGFSARKIKEETFGGKYINTPETPLFKKSRILFGLNYSRRRIAKERRALIVEGQIDALRLIANGFNLTVAALGTAFGEEHVEKLLKLGVTQVYLAFDGDEAGKKAAAKVGQLFQKEGVEVLVLKFPSGSDPDLILQKEGRAGFLSYLKKGEGYIPFLIRMLSEEVSPKTPAGKNRLVEELLAHIEAWKAPVMRYEGLKKIAEALQIPFGMLENKQNGEPLVVVAPVEKVESKDKFLIDQDRILETDLLRWLILTKGSLADLVNKNLQVEDLKDQPCRRWIGEILKLTLSQGSFDLLDLASQMEKEETQVFDLLFSKKVNLDKAKEGMVEVLQRILTRNWMQKKEEIRQKIKEGYLEEEKVLLLAKEFDLLNKSPPKVVVG